MFNIVEFRDYVMKAGGPQRPILAKLAMSVIDNPKGALLDTGEVAQLDGFNAMHLYLLIVWCAAHSDYDLSVTRANIEWAGRVTAEAHDGVLQPA